MEYNKDKDTIMVYSRKMGLSTLAKKLADLNADQISGFFHNRNIKIPRKINVMALIGALNERIKTLDSKALSRDGFSKLMYYPEFNEYLLESLFNKIGKEEDFEKYRCNLWALLIRNYEALQLLDGEVQYLINVRKQKMEGAAQFFERIQDCTVDLESDFDGIPSMNLESLLKNSYSQDDVRQLAKKYGIIIPNRLKKDELVVYVRQILQSKKRLTGALDKDLAEMTVVQLNSFCKLHQIEISANLKKNEIVFLFLFLLREQQIEKMKDREIFSYDWCEPLEFTVDLSAIDSFGRGTDKKIIILPNEEPEEETPEEPEEEPESKGTIIPIRVEGLDVLFDVEHGTILPDPNAQAAQQEPEDEPAEESEEEPVEELEEELDEELEEEPAEEPEEELDEELEDEPAEEPEEEPVEELKEELDEEPEEEPAEESKEKLDEEPEEEPTEEPEEEPTEAPEDEPTEEPEEEPTEEPEDEPAEEPEEEPADEPEEEPTEEPEEEPTEEPEDEPAEESKEELDEEPEDEPAEESEEELDEEPEDEPAEESEEELAEEPEDEPTEEPEEEPIEEPLDESYDEDFQKDNETEPEEMNDEGIENPFFRNKKLLSKKKAIVIACVAVATVALIVVGGFALLKLLL